MERSFASILTHLTEDIHLSDYNLSEVPDNVLRAIIKDVSSLKMEEVNNILKKCEKELEILNTENLLLEKQIMKLQPDALAKVERKLKVSETIGEQIEKFKASFIFSGNDITEILANLTSNRSSISSLIPFESDSLITFPRLSIVSSSSTYFSSKRLTYKFRMEMVVREIDEIIHRMTHFISSYRQNKFKILDKTEERKMAINYIKLTKSSINKRLFGKERDSDLNKRGSNIIFSTSKGMAIIHALNETTKNISNSEQRMRMQISVLNKKINKLKSQIKYMEEIGGKIYKIDFEELEVSNEKLKKNLEDKTEYCLKMRRATGLANQNTFSLKRLIDILEEKFKCKKNDFENKCKLLDKLNNEEDVLAEEISNTEKENKRIKYKLATSKAPELLDYAIIKSKIRETDKKLKILLKKIENQKKNIAILRGKLKKEVNSNQALPTSLKEDLLSRKSLLL